MRGKFITFEGGEGAGKSTQARLLTAALRDHGLTVVQTREVGGTPSAEQIRDLWLSATEEHWDALTEVLLIMAARREHLVKKIFPALESGAWVVCDRFIDSTRAYQGIGLDVGIDTIDAIYRQIAGSFIPDLTILLDLPAPEGLDRVASRGGEDDRYQQKMLAFHEKLRDTYRLLAKNEPERFRIVEANHDADDVAASVLHHINQHFGL